MEVVLVLLILRRIVVVTAILIGIFFFGEQVSNIQWMGVGLAFIGLYFIVLSLLSKNVLKKK